MMSYANETGVREKNQRAAGGWDPNQSSPTSTIPSFNALQRYGKFNEQNETSKQHTRRHHRCAIHQNETRKHECFFSFVPARPEDRIVPGKQRDLGRVPPGRSVGLATNMVREAAAEVFKPQLET